MDHSRNQTQEEPNFFKKMFSRLIENYTSAMIDNFKKNIQEAFRKIGLKTAAAVIIFTGLIFLLISLVILLNDLIEHSHSIGYAIVGVLTLIVGLLIGLRK